MKVLDLLCSSDHGFEGWFGSEDDFQSQQARGLVQCPLCGSAQIRKALSAPRLNLRSANVAPEPHRQESAAMGGVSQPDARPAAEGSLALPPTAHGMQAAWLRMARQVMAQTEDVGERFAVEARRIHQGEAEERGIRGQATVREAAELLEEGIVVLPLVLPQAAKETLQ